MATTHTNAPMSKLDQIKILRKAVAPVLADVITAEAVLLDAQTAASASIGRLIAKSGNPQHWITLHKGTENETKILVTFRKIGEYMGDAEGNPVQATVTETDGEASSTYPAGSKVWPLYGQKLTDGPDSD